MSATIRHDLLVEGTIEARAYQLSALDHCLSASTLLVLPTGMGKTPIEVMVLAERLRDPGGRGIMLAPTNALVNQHLSDLKDLLNLPEDDEIVGLTGAVSPKKRRIIWESAKIIVATPQVVRNDVVRGTLDLSDCSLLVVPRGICLPNLVIVSVATNILQVKQRTITLRKEAAARYWPASSPSPW